MRVKVRCGEVMLGGGAVKVQSGKARCSEVSEVKVALS